MWKLLVLLNILSLYDIIICSYIHYVIIIKDLYQKEQRVLLWLEYMDDGYVFMEKYKSFFNQIDFPPVLYRLGESYINWGFFSIFKKKIMLKIINTFWNNQIAFLQSSCCKISCTIVCP